MAQITSQPSLKPDAGSGQKPTAFRWVICGLLFYATTVNYIDRSTLNTLEPTLREVIHWRPYQYGLINAVFALAYGIGFLLMGLLVDKVGTRAGYALAMVGWSLSGLATAFTSTPMQFGMARFSLGLFEAGNFPAAIKTTAEWFPQKQRAMATGIFNAGSNVGAICAPLIVLLLVPKLGWRSAFFITPILVAIWLTLWLKYYRAPANQPLANDAERALIEADPIVGSGSVKWRNILPHRQAWAFMVGKFMTDPIWWFYLFWSGAFFYDKFGVNLAGVALPLIYIYVLADVGSIAGGWLSSSLIKKGWSPNAARKTAMSICAVFVLPVILAPLVPKDMAGGLWIAATLIGSAAAAHQGFSANMFTTASDMFPKRAVSSITGLGGLAGALGGVILQSVAGVTIELTGGSYLPLFIVAACAYPVAIVMIQFFAPRLEPASDERLETTPMPRGVTAFVFAVLGFSLAVPISYYFQGENRTLYRLDDRKTLVTMTFTEKSDELPRDLLAKASITGSDKPTPKVTLDLKREPTPQEAPIVAELNSYTNGDFAFEKAKEHFKPGFTFSEYFAAVLPPGNIYKSLDRDKLLPPLVWTPLVGIGIGALIGAALHGLLFSGKKERRA